MVNHTANTEVSMFHKQAKTNKPGGVGELYEESS